MSIFNELKRRNVFRVAIAYVVASWVLLQVADLFMGYVDAPDWVMHVLMFFIGLGFVVALIVSWLYELTSEGIKREKDARRGESITVQTGRKLDRIIIAFLAIAVVILLYRQSMLNPGDEPGLTVPAFTGDSVQATNEGPVEKSIAVLPFVNMSEETGNEYFADGLSEELLNMLVKTPELRVAARTSSFSFRGKDLKISDIAQELNVNHILEGSVRKSGDKVRITTQLIKAEDGFHLWSETFDRTLDDIFAVQDEIASRVANALQVTLLGQPGREHEVAPTAYTLWLKGLYFLQQREEEDLEKSVQALMQAIELDPDYALAWELLAMVYYTQTSYGFRTREDGYVLAMDAIDRAMSLDSAVGTIWGAYGFLKKNLEWDWTEARKALDTAHQLDPNSNIIRIWRGSLIQTLGRVEEAIGIYEQAMAVDPLNMSIYSSLGILYTKARRFDEAIAIFEKQIELRSRYHWAHFNLGKTHLLRGDAAQALIEIEKNPPNVYRGVGLVLAYSALGREADAQEALQRLVALEGGQNPAWVAEAYAWRGEKDKAFEWLEEAYTQRDTGLAYLLNNGVFENLQDDPRWAQLLQKMDLLESWQAMPPEYGGPTKPTT